MSKLFRCAIAFCGAGVLVVGFMTLPNRMPRAEAASAIVQTKVPEAGVWQRIDESSIPNKQKPTNLPVSYLVFHLNKEALTPLLNQTPLEFSSAAKTAPVVMTLPMPDGTLARFRIEESSIMEPGLAAKLPQIKTYQGQGLDDRRATTRFDWTPNGFHAIVLSAGDSVFIHPLTEGDTTNYISYYGRNDPQSNNSIRCFAQEYDKDFPVPAPPASINLVSGATLRTYRAAIGVTAEYTQAYGGGTLSGGLAAVTTLINNANAFFEKEIAVRLVLVANENLLISTNTSTDGYTHCPDPNFCDVSTGLDVENQTKIDNVIGSANYDIGHVLDGEIIANGSSCFGAAFFSVCVNGAKAKGGGIFRSCPPSGSGAVRLLAHEMGHQFTARHSYNGTTSGCTQRDSLSAFEPGSGSTIMSYTGNCAAENLPATSYYSVATLEQIIPFTTSGTGNGCAGQISTGNNPPTVSAGSNFTIPRSTPFTLTATGSDIDGDSLTYSWEEYDLATAAAPPNTDIDGQQRPIFRVFDPVISPSRTFPQLSDILNNTSTFGEASPTITRTMNFKVTVRDNRAGGGGVSNAAMQLFVRGDSGPFAVTAPSTAVTWTGGSSQTVSWNVNNTNLAPVSAANVKITLSTDGGITFPFVLAASTPNDGSQSIVVPSGLVTNKARVKVEAVGNVFFDISHIDFNLTPGGSCPAISSLSQSIGNVGASVSIFGANFTGVTAVKFASNVTATFTVNSDTKITTTVPAGAVTGPITLSKTGCSDLASSVFTVSGSAPSDLIADNNPGSFQCLAAGSPGDMPFFVNRLTPSSYPATLTSVSIYFPNCGLTVGAGITVVVGGNADGDTNINNTVFQRTPATVQALNAFNTYLVPNVTISSGDFVVGFQITTASGVFPAPYDGSNPHLQRSYMSFDGGANFDLLDNIFTDIPGNFGIRARVYSGTANCPTITGISPSSGPAGTTVTITGTNLSGIAQVKFSSNITVSFNLNSDTQITTTVPDGAVTGAITLSKTGCSNVQTGVFTISPTAVRLIDFTAKSYDTGVFLEWQTGFEVDNLGFNIYREEGGKRTLITPQLVAGSALKASCAFGAGASYAWWDTTDNKNATYLLEDIDLNGLSTWHAPIYTGRVGGLPPAYSQATLLGKLGADQMQKDITHVVEETASLSQASLEQNQVQASLASQPALKIAISHEGWYRVTQPELSAAGFRTTVDPRNLLLFVDGRELPIIVEGDEDGSLDAADAIEFYGVGPDSPYTDSRVYWLTSGNQPGLRVKQAKSEGTASGSSSFTHTVERRDRTIYFAALRNGERENFFGAVIARDSVNQSINVSHVSATDSNKALLEVALQGVTNIQHLVNVELNGAEIGVLAFDEQSQDNRKFIVPQSLLREGENDIRLTPLGGAGDISLVDYIRLSYQHSFTADGCCLKLTLPGRQLVTIDGFSSEAVRVIDVTEPDAAREIIGQVDRRKAGYAITFAAPAAGERSVLVFTTNQHPASLSLNRPSNLRAGSADVVVIMRNEFAESLGPLVELRRSQGLSVALVDVEDVYDEFSFGQKTPFALRNFLSWSKTNWKSPPRFVLLAGDASLDPKNYLGFGGADFVPTKLIDTNFLETSSDDWFSDFDQDGIADIATGRLPARSSEELTAMVAKIIRYEESDPSDEALLVADANDGFNFEQASAQLRSLLPSIVKVTQVDRGRIDPETARRSFFEALYRKQLLVNYVGHGSASGWRGNLLTIADARELSNTHLPFFVMMTCLNGYFQDAGSESLSEGLMKAEHGGGVAVWASSGMTGPAEQAILNRELFTLIFNSGRGSITLGEATSKAKTAIDDFDARRTWVLFGDPAIRLR